MRVLVIGLGNVLLGDEGLGVRALDRLLSGYELPPEVTAIDGGTLGLELLPHIAAADRLLAFDAVQMDRPPGTLVRLSGEDIASNAQAVRTTHRSGLSELLVTSELQGSKPARVVVCGMVPERLQLAAGLSPTVARRIDDLVACAAAVLEDWGLDVRPKPARPGHRADQN